MIAKYLIRNNQTIYINSFYSVVDKQVPIAQAKVFDGFGIPFNQIQDNCSHGEYLSRTAKTQVKECDMVFFFDIDCIPITNDAVGKIIDRATVAGICGIEQVANHYGNHIYAGPACVCFKTELYEQLGCPTFTHNDMFRWDVGEMLTISAERQGIKPDFLRISSVRVPKWKIRDTQFGHGTTYENLVYHEFEIRVGTKMFIEKCNQVIR